MASKTKIYIVLEYVDGGELFDQIVSNYFEIFFFFISLVFFFNERFGISYFKLFISLENTNQRSGLDKRICWKYMLVICFS